jgi:hypothetical protein
VGSSTSTLAGTRCGGGSADNTTQATIVPVMRPYARPCFSVGYDSSTELTRTSNSAPRKKLPRPRRFDTCASSMRACRKLAVCAIGSPTEADTCSGRGSIVGGCASAGAATALTSCTAARNTRSW